MFEFIIGGKARASIILHWDKNAIESKAFLSKSMYIMDSNQYAIELVTYLLVLVVYFYELIVYMLLDVLTVLNVHWTMENYFC